MELLWHGRVDVRRLARLLHDMNRLVLLVLVILDLIRVQWGFKTVHLVLQAGGHDSIIQVVNLSKLATRKCIVLQLGVQKFLGSLVTSHWMIGSAHWSKSTTTS